MDFPDFGASNNDEIQIDNVEPNTGNSGNNFFDQQTTETPVTESFGWNGK